MICGRGRLRSAGRRSGVVATQPSPQRDRNGACLARSALRVAATSSSTRGVEPRRITSASFSRGCAPAQSAGSDDSAGGKRARRTTGDLRVSPSRVEVRQAAVHSLGHVAHPGIRARLKALGGLLYRRGGAAEFVQRGFEQPRNAATAGTACGLPATRSIAPAAPTRSQPRSFSSLAASRRIGEPPTGGDMATNVPQARGGRHEVQHADQPDGQPSQPQSRRARARTAACVAPRAS